MTNPAVTISINGKETGLYFGYPCFSEYTQACVETPAYASLSDGSGVAMLLQAAYDNNCLIEKIKPSLVYKDFYLWVEDKINTDNKEAVESLLNTWAECTNTKKSLEKLNQLLAGDDEEKKSQLMEAV